MTNILKRIGLKSTLILMCNIYNIFEVSCSYHRNPGSGVSACRSCPRRGCRRKRSSSQWCCRAGEPLRRWGCWGNPRGETESEGGAAGGGGAAEAAAEVSLKGLRITECTAQTPSAPARIWICVLGENVGKKTKKVF